MRTLRTLFPIVLLLATLSHAQPVSLVMRQANLSSAISGMIILNGTDPLNVNNYAVPVHFLGDCINPQNLLTEITVQYGPTDTYGFETIPRNVPWTTMDMSIEATLTGYAPLYHSRLKGVNSQGTFYSNDFVFVPIDLPISKLEITALPSSSPTISAYQLLQRCGYPISVRFDNMPNTSVINMQSDLPYTVEGVLRSSIAEFYQNHLNSESLIQVLVNNSLAPDPLPVWALVRTVPLGAIQYMSGEINRIAFVYQIYNDNNSSISIDLQQGISFTIPALSSVRCISESSIELMYQLSTFMVVSGSRIPWRGSAYLTARTERVSLDSSRVYVTNSDQAVRSYSLRNSNNLEYTGTIPPYTTHSVVVASTPWDLYMYDDRMMSSQHVSNNYVPMGRITPEVYTQVSMSADTLWVPGGCAATGSFSITSSVRWSLSCDASWLSLPQTTGTGNQVITLAVPVNTTGAVRQAVIRTVDNLGATDSIIVVQVDRPQNALNFDGVDDYVSTYADIDQNFANGVTVEVWANWQPNSATDIQFLYAKGNEQLELHTGSSANNLRFIPTTGVFLDAPDALPVGVWTHIACVYHPAQSIAKMYINGIEVTLTNHGFNPITTPLAQTASAFSLGRRGGGMYRYRGSMDELRVWAGVRTQAQIQESMRHPLNAGNYTSLLCYYDFDAGFPGGDNSAGPAYVTDVSGHQFTGTMANFALTGATSNWVRSEAMTVVSSSVEPMAPSQLRITATSLDAQLQWNRVDTNQAGQPITVTNFLVYFRNDNGYPWQFLGYTTGASSTSYTHSGVVRFSPSMYYMVRAYVGSSTDGGLRSLRPGMSESEVREQLTGRIYNQ